MSETKDYVSQTLENGTIFISDEVIATIAAMAAVEVEGVYSLDNSSSDLGKLTKKNLTRGINVEISPEDEISIDCEIIVLCSYSVVEVAKAVQEAVTSTVESTSGRKVSSVNVNIAGISLPKTLKNK